MSDTKTNLADLQQLHNLGVDYFQPLWNSGLENKKYLRADPYSKKEKAKIKNDKRQPYSIALSATKMNRLLSEQRNQRFEWKPRARGAEDEMTAEIGGYVMKFIGDISNLKYEESEVYSDGLAGKYGVMGLDIDTTQDPRGDIILSKVKFDECMWDLNCTKYEVHKGAEWFERFVWVTRRKLKLEYPKKDVDKLVTDIDSSETTNGKQKINWYRNDKKQDLIKKIYHYDKVNKKIYIVMGGQDPKQYDTKKEAEAFVAEQNKQNAIQKILNKLQITAPTQYNIIPKDIEKWQLTVYAGSEILEEKTTDYLPYRVFFSFEDDGEIWCLMDLVKDPQQLYDRYFMMIDKATSKNIRGNNYTVVPELLHPDEQKDMNKLERDLVSGGRVVRVRSNKEDVFKPIVSHNQVQVESAFVDKNQELIEDILGGRTFQGLGAERRQTATEAEILEKGAKQAVFLYLDNFIRFKTSLGELVWQVMGDVYTQDRQQRITGDMLSDELKQLLQAGGVYKPSKLEPESHGWISLPTSKNSIADAKVDITIDNIEATETVRDRKYLQIVNLIGLYMKAGYQPPDPELLLEYMDIEFSLKEKIKAYYEEAKKKMEQQQQAEQQRANVRDAGNIINQTKDLGEDKPQTKVTSMGGLQ